MPLLRVYRWCCHTPPQPQETDMTTDVRIARRKLSLLELAQDLGNVSKACRIVGYSRQQFYEIRRNYQTFGAEGLVDKMRGPKGPHPNRLAAEIEQAILDHALEHPTHGPTRVAQALVLRGLQVSAGGVRGVWSRHDLLTIGLRPIPRRDVSKADRARAAAAAGEGLSGAGHRADA